MRSFNLLFGWLRKRRPQEDSSPGRARTGTQELPPAAPGQRDACAPTQPMAPANSSVGLGEGSGRSTRPLARPPVGVCTDVGQRRALNEDSYLTLDLGEAGQGGPSLYAVADGMGGYDAGEVASGLAVQIMAELAREAIASSVNVGDLSEQARLWLRHWVSEANHAVHEARQAANSEMGTTLVAAFVMGATATIANVGDSRCYHMGPHGIKRVTIDHSLVEQLVSAGQITRAEADSHPQRNVIYRAIGDRAEVEVDLYEQLLAAGEALLLCSDGLSSMVPDERIYELWRSAATPQQACDHLVAAANEAGGDDNITVVVIPGY